ncbi:hypothetical protein RDI58_022392 [Solanum bulbocastanum]|uniref:Uncharacterized protein n=1 Tax=Solanum bulbocastanum TaxID=147425 RepID=A0AAN8Y814_SOLBU
MYENMNSQRKIDADENAISVNIPISFTTPQGSKVDVSKKCHESHKHFHICVIEVVDVVFQSARFHLITYSLVIDVILHQNSEEFSMLERQ